MKSLFLSIVFYGCWCASDGVATSILVGKIRSIPAVEETETVVVLHEWT
jgi:hypothetical protein